MLIHYLIPVFVTLYALLGGALYMIRGGGIGSDQQETDTTYFIPGLLNINGWLKSKNLPTIRNLYAVALFFFPIVNAIFLYLVGFDFTTIGIITLQLSIGYIVAFVMGWGEYFDIGNWTLYYRGHREVLAVDWVLFKIFGPEWIPSQPSVTPDNPDFDLIESPTGEINSYEWRRNRDTVGLGLRHLMSSAIFVGLAILGYFFFNTSMDLIIWSITFTLMFALGTALIYRHFENPNMSWPSSPKWRYDQSAGRAEFYTGVWLHLLLAIEFLMLFF